MSTIEQRRDQIFPRLWPEEIERLCQFGEVRRYNAGDLLVETGERSPGMFVLIAGTFAVSAREGLDHVVPIVEEGPGQFLAEMRSSMWVQRPTLKPFSSQPRGCADSSSPKPNSTRRSCARSYCAGSP